MERELCASWFPARDRAEHAAAQASLHHPAAVTPVTPATPAPAALADRAAYPPAPAATPVAGPGRGPALAAPGGCPAAQPVCRGDDPSPELAVAVERILAAPRTAGTAAPVGAAAPAVEGALPATGHVAARREAGGAPAGTGRDPLGVHAEWSAEGVRVWVRAAPELDPGHVVSGLVRALLPHLAARGARLLGVVCNGKVAWAGPRRDPSEPFIHEPYPTSPERQEQP